MSLSSIVSTGFFFLAAATELVTLTLHIFRFDAGKCFFVKTTAPRQSLVRQLIYYHVLKSH